VKANRTFFFNTSKR